MSFERIRLRLCNAQQGYQQILSAWYAAKPWLMAGHRLHLEVRGETRSTAQNALLWSCLTDVSRQVEWYGQKLTPEDWKEMATAALKDQRVVPGIEVGKFSFSAAAPAR